MRTTEKEEKITKVDWLEAEIWHMKYWKEKRDHEIRSDHEKRIILDEAF